MIRNILLVIGLLCCFTTVLAEEPSVIVERAIRAHGGETALRRVAQAVRTGSGTLAVSGTDLPFTDEVIFDLPYRLRLSVTLDKQPKQTWTFDGEKAWQSSEGVTVDLPQPRADEMREEAYVQWLATVAPLKRRELTLTAVPDAAVLDRPVSVLKVVAKGRSDVLLSFDKESGLLVKTARRTREGGQAVTKESYFSAHKEFSGARLPTIIREQLNGKKFSELTSAKYELLRSRDDSLFKKP